ncbi:LysR substrate-binding domain-containing protein [Phytohabitans flavus]|uniref:LysR substrate-binding domain-containing protein n=1 Tax=Phytohabitans flavus TaxID=1076124 RepID=UPI0015648444|nr:LysR substrate-binding domain-containing protein [Phytohabitans flavus]
MDPHLLRTFVVVAERASFSAAARHLGYTQSAVSQHIAALEDDLGATLLHRRPVTPTEAGARLLEHAAPILLRLEAARADVRRTAEEPAGVLRVGVSALAAYHVGSALDEVRRARPGLDLVLRVAGRDAVVAGVAAGDLDAGLVDGVAAPSDPLRLGDVGVLTTVAVAEEPCAVLLPAGHPLARRAGLRLDDLVDARWIDAPDVGAPLADLRAAVGSDGLRGGVRYEGADVETLVALVAADHGLAILPARPTKQPAAQAPARPTKQPAAQAPAHPTEQPAAQAPERPPARTPERPTEQIPERQAAQVAPVPLTSPRLVYRTELVHGHLAGAAADFAAALTGSFRIRA